MIRKLKKIGQEIVTWWQHFIMTAPGMTGAYLRRRRAVKELGSCGEGLFLDSYCRVIGWPGISIGSNSGFNTNCFLASSKGKLKIGSNVSVNTGTFIGADFGQIDIGDDVLIGPHCVIRCSNHRFDQTPSVKISQQGHYAANIKIDDDVWIGANVTILPGAQIGKHCVIAAGAVVRGTFPPCSMIAGVPAKIIRTLGDSPEAQKGS